jgi:hypothetical protein
MSVNLSPHVATYLQSFLLSLESFLPSPQLQSWLCLDVVSLLRHPVARDRSSVIMNVPKSMPMTWPLTFSSPPVEAYRARNDVVGDRIFENREMGDDRGSYEKSVKAGS